MFNEMFNTIRFSYDSSNNEYISLIDYANSRTYDHGIVRGFFVTNGKYGERAVMVVDGYNINLPAHLLTKVKNIRANADAVKAINDGLCGYHIRTYEDGNNIIRYTVDLYDIKPE